MNYLFLFVFFCASLAALEPPIVYLTWQNDPTSTMTVHWLSPKENEHHDIEYCLQDSDGAWEKKTAAHKPLPENAPYTLHTIELTALKADCIYRFRIKPTLEEHLFRTMPTTNEHTIRFIAGGDLFDQNVEKFELTAKKAASENPRFFLIGGDIAYSVMKKDLNQEDFPRWRTFLQSWSTIMKDSQGVHIPILPTIGNHETKGFFKKTPKDAEFFYTLFATPGPQGYKMIRFGKYLSVAFLDSNITHPIDGEQSLWLKRELSSQIVFTHRFAIYHVPAFPLCAFI